MGYGATGNHEIIFVTGVQQEVSTHGPEYIAYPPDGYFPYNLIFEKWSFAIPYGSEVDYKNVKVEMTDSRGKKLSSRILSTEDPWYFDPAIVWEAEDLFSRDEIKYVKNTLPEKGFLDKEIRVFISNVMVNGEKKDYEYSVVPFDPGK
jgi:hypothetical protein